MAETSTTDRSDATPERLDVSPYDRVSSLMISLLLTAGLTTVVLVAGWLSIRIYQSRQSGCVPVGAIIDDIGEGGGQSGGSSRLDDTLTERDAGPDAGSADPVPDAAVIRAAADGSAADAAAIDDPWDSQRSRQPSGTGPNDGEGHGRKGRPRNWEVVFGKGLTLDEYARVLDFFKIELGVVRPGGKIEYAFHLSRARPDTRTITEAYKNEQRYWLRWTDSELKQADDALLQRAGVDPEGWLLKFVPRQTELLLLNLELAAAGSDRRGDVKRTRFGVRKTTEGYAFFVLEQTYK